MNFPRRTADDFPIVTGEALAASGFLGGRIEVSDEINKKGTSCGGPLDD